MDENVTPPAPEPTPASTSPPLQSAPPNVPPPLPSSFYVAPRSRARGGRGWKIFAVIVCVLLVISLGFNSLHMFAGLFNGEGALPQRHSSGPRLQENWIKDNGSDNRIVVVPIEGVI